MDKLNLCAGILCIIITIIGITTNLLTLLAIPFAAKRKKYVPIPKLGIFFVNLRRWNVNGS